MSKKPYDFLVSEKEPFYYINQGIVCMMDGFLTVLDGKNGKKHLNPAMFLVFVLGHGTSITQEAAIFCSSNDVQISFSRGMFNMHSIFMSGRYQNPEFLRNQIKNIDRNKISYAKKLLIYRFKLLNKIDQNIINEINNLENLNSILLYEARWAKKIYKEYSLKYKVNNFSRNFEVSKNNDPVSLVNERLNVLNNMFYSVCTAIILSTNLSPSIAILHGETRRGGLTFDLADLLKTNLIFDLAFDQKDISIKELMYKLSSRLKENNQFYLKILINICLTIGSDGNLSKILEVNDDISSSC